MHGVIVLYDEGCAICTSLAAWLARRGSDVRVAPIGSAVGDRLLGDLTTAERYAAFHAVDRQRRRRTGGAAIPLVLRALPGGALAGALAVRFPRATAALYDAVASRRSTLSRLARRL